MRVPDPLTPVDAPPAAGVFARAAEGVEAGFVPGGNVVAGDLDGGILQSPRLRIGPGIHQPQAAAIVADGEDDSIEFVEQAALRLRQPGQAAGFA
ncbi:hypothetical protein P6U16_20740 [Rhizobium sp. 32-5/1]|uniref:hypothetical protein n=1 Tax=Rhizobium sp. 32-5/1 TaxID=3019602 RepID=UPI00240CED00|nr:hypothetical protein [Rhizobium sp. 32-5/1]WEZ83243.1 hypothetical protein P6U16_20740 [Rhizobium sp. 32-5/1]